MSLAEWQSFAQTTGLRGWSRLKKDDLVNFLLENLWRSEARGGGRRKRRRKRNPLDWKNKKISAPILIPEKKDFSSKQIPSAIKQNVKTVVDWANWLESVDDVDIRIKSTPAVEKLKKEIAELWKQSLVVEKGKNPL